MFSVGTYNIQKPDASWHTRKEQLFENIKAADLDVVSLQEVSDSPADREEMTRRLHALGYEISTQTEKAGQTSLGVIWKKEKFTLVRAFTGTYTNGSDRKRCFAAVDLEDRATKKIIRVASVHLYTAPRDGTPHLGIPQLQTFRNLLEKDSASISRLVIAGDFNADPDRGSDSAVLGVLAQSQEGSAYAYHTVEKNGRGEKIVTKGHSKIDWIFVGSAHAKSGSAPKVTPHSISIKHTNASDHLMHALDVHQEEVPYGVPGTKSRIEDQVVAKLQECFKGKASLVRDDLIRAGLVTKETCNDTVSKWVQAGLIVQQGTGRDTVYHRGPQLGAASSSSGSADIKKLQECFGGKSSLVRDDLIRAGLVTKETCNDTVSKWVQAGLIVQQGTGRDTVYHRGPQLGAVPSSSGSADIKKLQECFGDRSSLVRDDLIRAGLVTRETCNDTVSKWVQAGLIVQQGTGRDTVYHRGPQLGSAPRVAATHATGGGFRRFTNIFVVAAWTCVAVISMLANAMFSQYNHGHGRYRH